MVPATDLNSHLRFTKPLHYAGYSMSKDYDYLNIMKTKDVNQNFKGLASYIFFSFEKSFLNAVRSGFFMKKFVNYFSIEFFIGNSVCFHSSTGGLRVRKRKYWL